MGQYQRADIHIIFTVVVGVISICWGCQVAEIAMQYRRIIIIFSTIISILLSIILIVYLNINTIIRLVVIRAIQDKDAFTSSGAKISIQSVSLTFGCRNRKVVAEQEGFVSRYSSRREERSCWNLELNHLHISNSASYTNSNNNKKDDDDDDYNAPYALHLNTLHISVAGPFAVLSLLQLPIATTNFFGTSSSLPRLYCNGLDFFVGFRVRSIDTLEIGGLSVYYIEDGDDNSEEQLEEEVIKSGMLWLERGKRQREFDFILKPTTLSWYESSKQGIDTPEEQEEQDTTLPDNQNRKSRGRIKLFPSSSIANLDDDEQFGIEIISDANCLILHASSIEERGAWVKALNGAIASLRYSHNGGGGNGNAPWFEILFAEANARKIRWQQREKLQRQKWLQKWQSSIIKDEDNYNTDIDEEEDNDPENEEDGSNTVSDRGGSFLSGIRNVLDGQRSHAKTVRFEDSLELRIGRMDIQQVNIYINDRTHVHLDENGWQSSFIGSSKELRTHLRLNLYPKLLKDSSGHAIKSSITEYTGKPEYEFGDITKAAVSKAGDAVLDFTGKDEYVFGDITKTVVSNVGEGVKEFTGKDEYQFGDITKTILSKLSPKKSNNKKVAIKR